MDIGKFLRDTASRINPFDKDDKTRIGGRKMQPGATSGMLNAALAMKPYAQVKKKQQMPQEGVPRTQQQISSSPFKMYEDNSYQGDPSEYSLANPGYRFYEDNTFTRPPQLQVRPGQSMQGYNRYTPNSNLVQGNNYNPQNSLEDLMRLLRY